jgi:hypothetical protein
VKAAFDLAVSEYNRVVEAEYTVVEAESHRVVQAESKVSGQPATYIPA